MLSFQPRTAVITSSLSLFLMLPFAASLLLAGQAAKQPKIPTAKAEAPADQAIVGAKLGGRFFAPKALKEKYDQLVAKVRTIEAEIAEGRISGEQASREVKQLRTELAAVRKEIDEQKKFVPVAKIHMKSDSTIFTLGSERRLLILADRVRIVGWDKPEVKCVLDKTILATGDENVDKDFEQIRVKHENRSVADEVGRLPEEVDAEEARYAESPEGKKAPPEQLKWRREFHEQNKASQRIYRPLQGRVVDVISVEGISNKDNRQISLEVYSPKGEGSESFEWQRHASLTVYVPSCEAIAVKGGRAGLDIESVDSEVIIRGDGNLDYHGQFRVKKLKGSLTADQVPLQTIEEVRGNVDVTMMAYLGNSGERRADNTRTSYVFLPEQYVYKNIEGSFRGRFVRADVELSSITGQVDVENEYGQTKLVVDKPLAATAYRFVSDGGQIDVVLTKNGLGDLGDLPVLAVSECGTVRLGFEDPKRTFKDVSWDGPLGSSGVVRGWRGFKRKAPSASKDVSESADRNFDRFDHFERISEILDGKDRTPGLDLVSRGGVIQIMRAK